MSDTPFTSDDFKQTLPLIITDSVVVFPYTVMRLPLDEQSAKATEAALADNRLVLIATRRQDVDEDAPLELQLHKVGVVGRVEQSGMLPSGVTGVVVRGIVRAEIGELSDGAFLRAAFTERPDRYERTPELENLMAEVRAAIDSVLDAQGDVPQEIRNFVRGLTDPSQLADNTGYSPDYSFEDRQDLLETFDVVRRLEKIKELYQKQLTIKELQSRLRQEVQDGAARQQREFYLRQQMRAIQKELGEDDAETDELDALREKLAAAEMPTAARKESDREMSRLGRMNTASPEYQMVRTYLEWMAELPWNKTTGDAINVAHAREVLDADHYGLEKIKERILEYLSVKQRRATISADGDRSREPILLFVGPPGVGKTSLGQSIARSLGRQFVRMSLGGVRDEAELRGFRRTYIGSQPGRIIQELRRAGASDPVVLLDEVDKIGQDYRGDPAAALLEVLDPEQNNTFTDHYLNVPYDLSKVLFIATANDLSTIPGPLRDRMEVIELAGYIENEKVHIARQHLIPKQIKASGLRAEEVEIEDAALRTIIGGYTREAGVRNLERQIGGVLRKVTRKLVEESVVSSQLSVVEQSVVSGQLSIVEQSVVSSQLSVVEQSVVSGQLSIATDNRQQTTDNKQLTTNNEQPTTDNTQFTVTPDFVRTALGRPRFQNEAKERIDQPGIATGLVWTPVGGDIVFVEATALEGSPGMKITGQLGEVMRESAEAALTYVRSRAKLLGIDPTFFDSHSVHIHVPAGAVPKDGPSAGITMATALASAATGRFVRDDVAMTGEISLRGRVLPIGGIKEKALGAHRAGITTIILPRRNMDDLDDLPREVFDALTFVPVDTLDEVLITALSAPQNPFEGKLTGVIDMPRDLPYVKHQSE